MLVALVDVATAGVGLPDLDELVAHRPAVAVEHPAGDDHPLADRLAAVLDGQVGLERVDVAVRRSTGAHSSIALGVGVVQVLGRVPQHAAAVRRVVEPRLGLAATGRAREALAIAAISALTSAWVEARLGGRGSTRAR